jgi:peptidylprolyl isomerase
MKFLLLVGVVACLALSACGSGEAETSPAPATWDQVASFGAVSIKPGGAQPQIEPPNSPPPGQLRSRDLVVGSGPAARRGDEVFVYYVGVEYKSGRVMARTWLPRKPLVFNLGTGGWDKTWEEGIEGMRAGGIRELVVPEAFPDGPTLDFVVKLVRVRG